MFQFPSLSDCVEVARSAWRAALPGTNAWVWPNSVGPAAKVVGAAEWQLYQRLDYVQRQAFASTAEGGYLDRHGAEYNLPRKLATAASGNVVVTVTGAAAFASGGTFARGDGVVFTASAAASIASAGTLTVPVTGPSGLSNNTLANAPMTILSGLSGAGATGATAQVDSAGLAGGADVEPDGAPFTRDLSTYRGRIIFRKSNPPQGGAPADYVSWALAVPGCTRVFVERRYLGPGTVRVFPLFDGLFTGGVPDAAHVTLVANAIAPLAPAAASVTVAAATAVPIDLIVSGLNPPTAAARLAVSAELADAIARLGQVSGSDSATASMPFLADPFTWLALWSEQAVAEAAGVIGADVSASDVVIPAGSIPVPGTVSFV